jgi:cytochrome b561
VVALLVVVLIIVGLLLGSLPQGPIQNTAYTLHKSFGFLVLPLMMLRLAVKLLAGTPPPEPTLERWHIAASHAVHGLLYVALFGQPILGLFANSAYGAPLNLFWLVEIPPLIEKDEALSETLFSIHERLGYAIAALAAVHVSAALYHHIIRRDGVLRRMAPRGWV